MAIRSTLKSHKEGIAALQLDGFVVQPVRFGKGDHLIVQVTRGRGTGRVTISGSPRGSFIGTLVAAARRAVREG